MQIMKILYYNAFLIEKRAINIYRTQDVSKVGAKNADKF